MALTRTTDKPINKHLALRTTEFEWQDVNHNVRKNTKREIVANRGEMVRAYLLLCAKGAKIELPYTVGFPFLGEGDAPEMWMNALPQSVTDYEAYRLELEKLDMWKYDDAKADELYQRFKVTGPVKQVTVDAEDIEQGDDELQPTF